ncbi:hypothetical protein BKA67DRAFT_660414 [Truncatella angustata]|uniref:Uncharacterized protein n=1 Tax=Truncatella angustata TaxID=152316 RepID=A0A9P8ZW55_9PEZI|nr:uncharacterized protein BKA67DRAFT_660414 [Truncatella angustata]KAH6651618.1 hypothetical protein BKA67DRAFT_660414 [Truncatella angustata]KAH8203523.1 hypothetical protein TruAng_002271 [Truncatella angustata]
MYNMKATTSILAVLFAMTTSVVADSCNRGGVYCGSSLLRKGGKLTLLGMFDACVSLTNMRINLGNYQDHIVDTLNTVKVDADDKHIQNSLFDCLSDGDIKYVEFCINGCGGTASTDPDYCLR